MSLVTLHAATRPVDRPSTAIHRVSARRILGRLDPLAIAVLTAAISAAGASRPSLWFDEAATISASTRSLSELWRLLGHIDAVHGLYYVLMHGWFTILPVTEFWARAPSCLAVGVTGAGIVVLAKQFTGRPAAICAGVAFAILPRTTWAGVEARSYAFTALAAVWLLVLLVMAVRRNRWWAWLTFTATLPVAVILNAFLALVVGVHAVAVASLTPRRSVVARWALSTTAAAVLAAPFLAFTRTQFAQVSWLSPLGPNTVGEVLRDQYFDDSAPFAIVAGVIVVAALVVRGVGAAAFDVGTGRLMLIALAWITLPTAALLLYTQFAAPIYYPRYLCFTTPAMALILGACIAHIARKPVRMAAVLLALVVAAAPNFVLSQRGPYKREGMDYSQIADVLTGHARPGDCLLLDNTTSWKPGPIRPLLAARPAAYRDLVDLGRGARATTTDRLWDGYVPLWLVQDGLRRCTVVWTISERDHTLADHDAGGPLAPGPRLGGVPVYQIPRRMGFRIVERWQFSFAQITRSTRLEFPSTA